MITPPSGFERHRSRISSQYFDRAFDNCSLSYLFHRKFGLDVFTQPRPRADIPGILEYPPWPEPKYFGLLFFQFNENNFQGIVAQVFWQMLFRIGPSSGTRH
jgi:hypothetical protein